MTDEINDTLRGSRAPRSIARTSSSGCSLDLREVWSRALGA